METKRVIMGAIALSGMVMPQAQAKIPAVFKVGPSKIKKKMDCAVVPPVQKAFLINKTSSIAKVTEECASKTLTPSKDVCDINASELLNILHALNGKVVDHTLEKLSGSELKLAESCLAKFEEALSE